jgi:hypothetical protein
MYTLYKNYFFPKTLNNIEPGINKDNPNKN